MIEFPVTIVLYQALSRQLAAKGRSTLWALVAILFWYVGEAMGFLLLGAHHGFFSRYLVGLALASAGALIGWAFVRMMPGDPAASAEELVERRQAGRRASDRVEVA